MAARTLLVASCVLGIVACQAFLTFDREPVASGPDAALDAVDDRATTDAIADVKRDAFGDRNCGAGLCIDFEESTDIASYGLDSGTLGAEIATCATPENPNNHCLRYTQPGWRFGRTVPLASSIYHWDLSLDCQFESGDPAFAYVTYTSFGWPWVVAACEVIEGKTMIRAIIHDTSGPTGVIVDDALLGPSPARVRFVVDLAQQKVLASVVGGEEHTLLLPDDVSPKVLDAPEMTFGAFEGARFTVSIDDIALTLK